MKKIRFELDIDEVVESQGCIQSNHDCFKGEDKAGKLFLFVDRMTGTMRLVYARKVLLMNEVMLTLRFSLFPSTPKFSQQRSSTEKRKQILLTMTLWLIFKTAVIKFAKV